MKGIVALLAFGLVFGALASCANAFSWGFIVEFTGRILLVVSAIIWLFSLIANYMDTSFSRAFWLTSGVLTGWLLVKGIIAM